MNLDGIVERSIQLLRYAYGITLIVIGLDKAAMTYLIVEWEKYVSPLALSILPVDPTVIAVTLGIAEIVVGILFFTRYVKIAGWIAIATLAVIVVNLLSMGLIDIAARDILIALGVLVLIWLYGAKRTA